MEEREGIAVSYLAVVKFLLGVTLGIAVALQ